LLFYGGEPQVNPWVGRPEIWAQGYILPATFSEEVKIP
jgi:hypothetical protein